MRCLTTIALLTLLVTLAWARGARAVQSSAAPASSRDGSAVAPGILYPPLPTNMSLPTYDYADPETRAGSHFIDGTDRRSRALGVIWDDVTQTWQLTGSGWLSSMHSQSDHGSTENAFCAKCHSPLQASAAAGFDNGAVVNAGPVPQQRFEAVTCATCHTPDNIAAQIVALNPNALYGAGTAIYLWKGVNNPASYQILDPGVNSDGTSKEDLLCLHCHEQRHNTDDSAFEAMYTTTHGPGGGPVRCIDCHMAPYQTVAGDTEMFHNWNVGADLPSSCGAVGSVSGCHNNKFTMFTVTDAQNIIPFIKEQHSDWWSLPPFNGVPQVAMTAHGAPTLAEYKILEREISKIDAMGTQ